MSTESANREYIQKKISHILEPMVTNILVHRPDNPHQFMIQWLHDHFGSRAARATRERLNFLRSEVERLKEELGDEESDKGSEHETDESDEDDYLDELPEKL